MKLLRMKGIYPNGPGNIPRANLPPHFESGITIGQSKIVDIKCIIFSPKEDI